MYGSRHYLTADEKNVYLDWVRKLRDVAARIAIDQRVNRVETGNFGDHKPCRDGVRRLFYSCVEATSERRTQMLTAPASTGKGE